AAADFLEEPVNLERMIAVAAVDDRERVKLDAMFLQQFDPAHHALEGGLAAFGHAKLIVQFARPVDRDADEKTMFRQKPRPLLVQQNSIGLKGVDDLLARAVTTLERDCFAEKINTQQGRLAALPRKTDDRRLLRLDVLPYIVFEHDRGHPPVGFARIQL